MQLELEDKGRRKENDAILTTSPLNPSSLSNTPLRPAATLSKDLAAAAAVPLEVSRAVLAENDWDRSPGRTG